ncbi:hypothetical protein KY335_02715 [Candidatus Woesearchaeota archaeon]|nr:hypothetical protein [Candidatus Woesearchaeota archaeon]
MSRLDGHSKTPVTKDNGFVDLDLPSSWGCTNFDYGFSRTDPRRAVESVYVPGDQYTLISTAASPLAIKALEGYVASREKMEAQWKIRKAEEKDDCDVIHFLSFGASLMDTYIAALQQLAATKFEDSSYASFSIMYTHGVHSVDRMRESATWPFVHIVRGGEEEAGKFRSLVMSLGSDDSWKALMNVESPQFYRTAEIQFLRERNISPLEICSEEWKVDSDTLRNAVNFLVQFRITCDYAGS